MSFLKKIPAGSLQFVVMIAAVIAILLGSFVLLVHTHGYFKKQNDLTIETVRSVDRGFNQLLEEDIPNKTAHAFRDIIDPRIQLNGFKDRWGVFERLKVTAIYQNKRFVKSALICRTKTTKERIGLYLQDKRSPLVLVGKTYIRGNVYIPASGIKLGYIGGTSYYGKQLIRGRAFTSEEELPMIDRGLRSHLESLLSNISIKDTEFLDPKAGEAVNKSFFDKTINVYETGTLRLSAISLQGNIVVQSKTKIIVDASSNLQDVLLIAPKVEIKAGFKGNLQVLASKKVEVGENVHLNYPSAIVVINKEKKTIDRASVEKEYPAIHLMKGSKIHGLILFLGETTANNFLPQVVLEEKSIVEGELYCQKNLELRGSVYGSVYVGNLLVREAGSIYQNHLYNATIDVSKLPDSYAGYIVNSENKTIMQWLY